MLELGLAKSDLRLLPLPKVKFKDFPNIIHFTLSFLQALFKRWIDNKLKVVPITFTSYSIVICYTQFNQTI